jgi:hypothetical protein
MFVFFRWCSWNVWMRRIWVSKWWVTRAFVRWSAKACVAQMSRPETLICFNIHIHVSCELILMAALGHFRILQVIVSVKKDTILSLYCLCLRFTQSTMRHRGYCRESDNDTSSMALIISNWWATYIQYGLQHTTKLWAALHCTQVLKKLKGDYVKCERFRRYVWRIILTRSWHVQRNRTPLNEEW